MSNFLRPQANQCFVRSLPTGMFEVVCGDGEVFGTFQHECQAKDRVRKFNHGNNHLKVAQQQ